MQKVKDYKSFISDDPSLSDKISYDEVNKQNKGIDDSGIKEAYESYKKVEQTIT